MVEKIIHTMNDAVNEVYQAFVKAYTQLVKTSHMESLKNLKAGEVAPDEGVLLPAYQEKMKELIEKYRSEALEKVNEAKDKITEVITTAPSEDALRALSAFRVSCPDKRVEESEERERIANEIDMLTLKYDNYLIYEAYRSLAETIGIHDFREHPANKAMKNIGYSESFIAKEISSAVRNHNSSPESVQNLYKNLLMMNSSMM